MSTTLRVGDGVTYEGQPMTVIDVHPSLAVHLACAADGRDPNDVPEAYTYDVVNAARDYVHTGVARAALAPIEDVPMRVPTDSPDGGVPLSSTPPPPSGDHPVRLVPCVRIYQSGVGTVCHAHGGLWADGAGCPTQAVLSSVADHRQWQYARWGANRSVPDGTGPDAQWVPGLWSLDENDHGPLRTATAKDIERLFRAEWDYKGDGTDDDRQVTWLKMVREEVAEAFAESDPDRLEEELIQVAALCVSWIEKIRERRTA